MVGDLLDRAFGGSAAKLMMQALSGRKASPEEFAQMRQMLADFETGSETDFETDLKKGKEPQP